ncbi:MAG: hypothetical protein JW893_05020 [Candidatus Omnitrophica bacterium]|nr:hypothetical protein [Candidatus Omnitrophota bacterium]
MQKYLVAMVFLFLCFNWALPAKAGPSQGFEIQPMIQIEVEYQKAGYTRQNRFPAETLHRSREVQTISVMSGLEARLFIGKRVPYIQWYRTFLYEEGYLAADVILKDIGTSLIVKPQLLGNVIVIELIPEISYETNDGRGSIAVTRLRTTVRAGDGQSIEIGGSTRESEFAQNFYRNESGEEIRVILTPHVMR